MKKQMQKIDCFIPFSSLSQVEPTLESLSEHPLVGRIFLLSSHPQEEIPLGTELLQVDALYSTATMQTIAEAVSTDYFLFVSSCLPLRLGYLALERFSQLAADSGASLLYADRYQEHGKQLVAAPVIDYQQGSLRDDFDFGSLLFFSAAAFRHAAFCPSGLYQHAGLYDLRLILSRSGSLVHINEPLYTELEYDARATGEKIFDYVDPRQRARQIEMEQACTAHLKAIGAYLEPQFDVPNFDGEHFDCEATVVIPVRNRIRTIMDAVRSVLSQKTDFKFNLIVVDNHSTDGTTEALQSIDDDRLLHLLPSRADLGIGGCWNYAVHSPHCGKFVVQLDSDDVYSSPHTLSTIVRAFYEQQCAMVVGTYQMTDFDMNPLPPGIIDHKEWTPDNGRNNALRINGLGAPRAFYTPLLRTFPLPNTSYGEDYALGLRFSRHYQVGRIYEVLYLCRRWEDNSDAALDVVKMNANNLYKDRLRTWEVQARISLNGAKTKAQSDKSTPDVKLAKK